MIARKLIALMLLLALGAFAAPLPAAGDSIKLPPGFPAQKDDLDAKAPFKVIPTNPDLVKGPSYQPIGLNLAPATLSPALLANAESFGFGAYRLTIHQEDFSDPNSPNLIVLGDVLGKLRAQGAQVMLTMESGMPSPDGFMEFFKLVDNEVGGMVDYYQLLDGLNFHLGVSAQSYGELLGAVRAYRDSSQSKFSIVCGGIQGVDYKFITELQHAYIFGRVDVIAFNLYPDPSHIEFPSQYEEPSPPSVYETVQMMDSLRRYNKPFFITSLGVSTAYAPLGVSQLDQVSMLCRSVFYLLNGGASRIFLTSLADTDANNLFPQNCMGLYDYDGNEKPAANAVRRLTPLLKGSYFFEPYYLFQMHNNFPAAADPIFAHHLYNPVSRATYYIYWTSSMNMYDRTTNLAIFRPGLEPVAVMNLLTGEVTKPAYNRGGNLLIFAGMPLSHIPFVIQMTGEKPNG